MNFFIISFCVFFIHTKTAQSQDTHYWTQQFGTKSALLGGAVVGGVRDNSAIIYNPGALAFVDSVNISVSANGYQYDVMRLKDGAGNGLDLKSNLLQIIPLITTGIVKFQSAPLHTIGYSLIQSHQVDFEFSARKDGLLPVMNPKFNPGFQEYIGQFYMKNSLRELLGGISYSFKISPSVGIGFTNFIAYRTQSVDYSFVGRVLPSDDIYALTYGDFAASNDIYSIYFSNVRMFWKIGMNFNFNKLKIGFAVTTPSLNININAINYATIGRDISINNLNVADDDASQPQIMNITANDRQADIKSVYKSPLSISFGVEYKIQNTLLCTSMEWFNKIDFYDLAVPNSKAFLRPSNSVVFDSQKLLKIREGNQGVTNFAFGIEHEFSKKISVLISYRTNNSFFLAKMIHDDRDGMNMCFSDWDLKHITLGFMFKKTKSDFSFGISYAYAHNIPMNQQINLSEPKESTYLKGEIKESRMNFNSVGLIFGYTYYFQY